METWLMKFQRGVKTLSGSFMRYFVLRICDSRCLELESAVINRPEAFIGTVDIG